MKTQLAHHAVEARSVLIIVDSEFDEQINWLYRELNNFAATIFETLKNHEFFGLKNLDDLPLH